ncbi:MAG: hypothetical protein IKW19_09480 [Akkermansia sp.]|nr:hypothetical protein [Akkermansia sp.]
MNIFQYFRYYFVLQPPLCSRPVQMHHSADVGPFAAPNQAAYGNLCIIRGKPRKVDCPAQLFFGIGFQFGIFIIGTGGTVRPEQQFLGFTAGLVTDLLSVPAGQQRWSAGSEYQPERMQMQP